MHYATPKSQGTVAWMQEMPVEPADGGLQKVANGEAMSRCSFHVLDDFVFDEQVRIDGLMSFSFWQVSGVMEPHEESQALRANFGYEEIQYSVCSSNM